MRFSDRSLRVVRSIQKVSWVSCYFLSILSGEKTLPLPLTIYTFAPMDSIARSLTDCLGDDRYCLTFVKSPIELLDGIEEHKEKIDCLVVLHEPSLRPIFNHLYETGILLPVVMIVLGLTTLSPENEVPNRLYHRAEMQIPETEIGNITGLIDQAIARFLYLAPNCSLTDQLTIFNPPSQVENKQSFLLLQQQRLAEKLKERLGYLGVYYKRNPQDFYRNLSRAEKGELLDRLRENYREIILNYFIQEYPINQAIDQFVNYVFFVDISVSQILEIHMELMDQFSQQLKLEGRSEEILLDYRLALIDILAHLGEMYRRSIPREDIPYDLLLRTE
jgi:circadian clock protein KaiA